jgi:hypothetical protein
VSRKDRYSSTIINRSREESESVSVGSNHHDRRQSRPFATTTAAAASDNTSITNKKKGSGIMEDHWSDLYQPTAAVDHHQRDASSLSAGVIIPIQNEIDIALLQRHLIEGIIEHQTLLLDDSNTVVYNTHEQSSIQLDQQQQQQQQLSSSSAAVMMIEEDAVIQTTTAQTITTSSTPSSSTTSIIPRISSVWKARLLLLLSAALYGTNFTLVKSIDDIPGMSVGLASSFRFGFASLVMLPLLFTPVVIVDDDDDEWKSRMTTMTMATEAETEIPTPTRISIIGAGMEIGLYNSIGYLFQAEGLKTTTASKVSERTTTTTYTIEKVCVCRWCVCVSYLLFVQIFLQTIHRVQCPPPPHTHRIYRVPSFAPWHV